MPRSLFQFDPRPLIILSPKKQRHHKSGVRGVRYVTLNARTSTLPYTSKVRAYGSSPASPSIDLMNLCQECMAQLCFRLCASEWNQIPKCTRLRDRLLIQSFQVTPPACSIEDLAHTLYPVSNSEESHSSSPTRKAPHKITVTPP